MTPPKGTSSRGMSRRELIRNAGIAGAAAWTAPVIIDSLSTKAFASFGSPQPKPGSLSFITFNLTCGAAVYRVKLGTTSGGQFPASYASGASDCGNSFSTPGTGCSVPDGNQLGDAPEACPPSLDVNVDGSGNVHIIYPNSCTLSNWFIKCATTCTQNPLTTTNVGANKDSNIGTC
jgi:hypothetical protein